MALFRTTSIKRKVIAISTTMSGIALLLSGIALGLSSILTAKHSMLERLTTQANIIGANCASALLFDDESSAQETLSALKAESPIINAGIYSKDMALFASYKRADLNTQQLPIRLPQHQYTSGSERLEVVQPVLFAGEAIGTVYMQADLTVLYAQFRQQAALITGVFLISFLVGLAILSKLQGMITGPIMHLAETAKAISRDKDYGVRVEKQSEDEIGSLMDAFNEMLTEIQRRDEKLEGRARELQRLNEQLIHQAYHDTLTELANRELFNDRLTQAIIHFQRDQRLLAVLFLDLDRFKNINDTLGHVVGDQLLKLVAARLLKFVRKADTVARQGGDEFTILLNAISFAEDSGAIAKKILKGLESPFLCAGHEFHVTASIGIAIYPNDAQDSETLMRNADAAMYHAKRIGGNNYSYYDPGMHAKLSKRLTMENSLRRALEREEFVLHYQPLCEIAGQTIVGAEALIRWRNPNSGVVSPADFIPILEETGLIIPVGEWIFKKVCVQASTWREAGFPTIRVSINLSSRQFRRHKPAATIREIINETGFPADNLTLEITESILMEDTEEAIRTLHELSAMGLSLAIDDFGTGYSSLSYLKRFPIDAVKIDQSFVSDITADRDDAAIVKATIAMAHALGLKVVAEGVETEEQLAYLRLYGCDIVQGYLFGRPLPDEEFISRLAMQYRGPDKPMTMV